MTKDEYCFGSINEINTYFLDFFVVVFGVYSNDFDRTSYIDISDYSGFVYGVLTSSSLYIAYFGSIMKISVKGSKVFKNISSNCYS